MSNQEILLHCAPTLANVKIGSLFTIAYTQVSKLEKHIQEKNAIFNKKGVSVRVLKHGNGKALIYIFREKQLEQLLQNPEIQEFLREFHYESFTLEAGLEKLKQHLQNPSFPHEIGVFLGYPLEDIRGFIKHQGKNFKHSGCWKVYHDTEKALMLFQRYKKCVAIYLDRYAQGFDMNRLTVAS